MTGVRAIEARGADADSAAVAAKSVGLTIECIETTAGISALAAEWERLFVATGSNLPFWTFDWAETWWHHFQRHQMSVRDAPRVYTVRAPTGRLIAVAPMMLTERPAVGPMRARSLAFFGADPNMTELKGVICADTDAEQVHRALLHHLMQRQSEWDWVDWTSISSRCSHLFTSRSDIKGTREVPNYVLALPDSWEEMKKGLKRNIRESLRKCYNSLLRDGHVFEFHVATTAAEVPSSLAHLFRLHSARSALSGTTPHADVFATEHSRCFLQDVCVRLATKGHWRAFTLSIAGRVVAVRIGFRFNDALYLYYSGFDPEWGKYSIMTTTVAEAIKHSISHGIKRINLSTGNDVSKTRWSPTEVSYLDATLTASALRSRLAHRAYRYGFDFRHPSATNGRTFGSGQSSS